MGESFERDIKDMLALQSEVASEIANEIQIKVTPAKQLKVQNIRPVNPKALDAYLEARFHFDQAGKSQFYKDEIQASRNELTKAVSKLDQAIQEDPNYTPAYLSYFDAVDFSGIDKSEFLPRAKAALTEVLERDESDAEAHLVLARLLMQYEYDWPGAEREIKRSLELNPNSAEAHYQYFNYLGMLGRSSDSEPERGMAQALDPGRDYFANSGVSDKGRPLMGKGGRWKRRHPTIHSQSDSWRKIMPSQEGTKKPSKCGKGALRSINGMILWWSSSAQTPKEARSLPWRSGCEQSRNIPRSAAISPFFVPAFTYASLGNRDRAFAWRDKAYAERNWCIIYLKPDHVWDPLRSDPRFSDLLRRVGLPQ